MRNILQRIVEKVRKRLREAQQARALRSEPFALVHAPESYARRAGDFTANLYGVYGRDTRGIRYALNGGPYLEVHRQLPRVPAHEFMIEFPAGQLKHGRNRLELQVIDGSSRTRSVAHEFTYECAAPVLPTTMHWNAESLDVGDGLWETLERDETRWLRPRPGHEGYDRSVIAVGAFRGGRRLEIPIVYRSHRIGRPFGFGVHPLWGGRPDPEGQCPRRGWNFSFAGYYSHYKGVGMEFSYRAGGAEPRWVGVYRNFDLQPDCEYRLIVEVRPDCDVKGAHLCYRQRMRFESGQSHDEGPWLELSDSQGAPLRDAEYGVAVLAHSCQVEFGPLMVTNLPAGTVPGDGWRPSAKQHE